MRAGPSLVCGALALACALSLYPAPARADAWSAFHPPNGGFTVRIPGEPSNAHQSNTLPNGMQAETELYSLRVSGEVFFVGVTTYSAVLDVPTEPGLDRDNFNRSVGGATTTSQKDATSNGVAGIDVISETATFRFHQLWFTDGRRAWGAVFGMPIAAYDPASANRFLRSFALTP